MHAEILSPEVLVFVVSYFVAHLGAMFGAYVSIKVSIARLEVKVDAASKDIDGLAKIIGTERSKGT